jgi:hypothetical protein
VCPAGAVETDAVSRWTSVRFVAPSLR